MWREAGDARNVTVPHASNPLRSSFSSELPEDDLTASVASVGELGLQSPMSDGTIEEDFEAALAKEGGGGGSGRASGAGRGHRLSGKGPVVMSSSRLSPSSAAAAGGGDAAEAEDFSDISRHGILEVVGDDAAGRKVIVVSACRLPSNKSFDHQRFLRLLPKNSVL